MFLSLFLPFSLELELVNVSLGEERETEREEGRKEGRKENSKTQKHYSDYQREKGMGGR